MKSSLENSHFNDLLLSNSCKVKVQAPCLVVHDTSTEDVRLHKSPSITPILFKISNKYVLHHLPSSLSAPKAWQFRSAFRHRFSLGLFSLWSCHAIITPAQTTTTLHTYIHYIRIEAHPVQALRSVICMTGRINGTRIESQQNRNILVKKMSGQRNEGKSRRKNKLKRP